MNEVETLEKGAITKHFHCVSLIELERVRILRLEVNPDHLGTGSGIPSRSSTGPAE